MRNRTHLLLAAAVAAVAALMLSAAVGTASANRLSISNRNLRSTWSSVTFEPGEVRCAITLEGSFHSSTFNKVRGALVGHISRAIVKNETCTNGHVTILQERLPWHVRYHGFEGTLPSFSHLEYDLVGASAAVNISLFGITCLTTSTATNPIEWLWTIIPPSITLVWRIPLTGPCAALGETTGSAQGGRLTLLGTATAITVRLI